MVYFVTSQSRLGGETNGISISTFDKSLEYFKNHTTIQVDTETTGFDCFTCELLCVQLGDSENQWVIEKSSIDFKRLKTLLENPKVTCYFQNAKFDLKFLYRQEIYPKNIFDTFLAELVLTTGTKRKKKKEGDVGELGLDALALKYANATLDKSIRANINKEGLTDRVILYSADDVKYLEVIASKQMDRIRELDLEVTLRLENSFVKALAYTEYCGFKLDQVKWLENEKNNHKLLAKKEQELTDWIKDKDIEGISKQFDLFGNVSLSINWGSSKQVIKLFESLGVECLVTVKGKTKKTAEFKFIEKQKDKSTLIPIYLEYKKIQKQISTYGKKFLKFLNPVTHRIHSDYFQIINTGRLSSARPNLQNITSTEEVRSCFVADKGNSLSINDYSSQEPRNLAGISKDSALLDFFFNGDADIHCFVASKLYSILNGKDTKITKANKYERQVGKILNLKLNYGGSAYTVKDDLGKTEEEAEVFIKALEAAFPEKEEYFKAKILDTFKNGYITTNKVTRRKIFIPGIKEFLELEKLKDGYKKSNKYPKDFWKKYYTLKGEVERCSKNYPIQSSAADQSKIAGILFFNWIKENNLIG
jgi:DNA polymerase-1